MSDAFRLRFEGVGKSFSGIPALAEVSFGVKAGSVHALMGENGAGKSTLLKILSGAHERSCGEVFLDGKSVRFADPASAIAGGVGMIHQELSLVPQLTVAENLFLGHLPSRKGVLDRKLLERKTREILDAVGEDLVGTERAGSLPPARQQMVEIAKALARNPRILAFDEPTSSLTKREIESLFKVVRRLQDSGVAILYVTHRMEEVFRVADAITVLRDGRHVETWHSLADLSPEILVRKMVGREVGRVERRPTKDLGAPRLRVNGVTGAKLRSPASFEVRAGEIVGLFGLVGSGRSELLHLIAGADPRTAGEVTVDEESIPCDIGRASRGGIALCPEDRRHQGILRELSVRENINLSERQKRSRVGILDEVWESANPVEMIARMSLRPNDPKKKIGLLSGGNQQKAVLGRLLSTGPKVLLLDEPTRGIDVGAKFEIYRLIHGLAAKGLAVVFVSGDLPEVMSVSDRILVLCEGAITGELSHSHFTEEKLLSLALPGGAEVP